MSDAQQDLSQMEQLWRNHPNSGTELVTNVNVDMVQAPPQSRFLVQL